MSISRPTGRPGLIGDEEQAAQVWNMTQLTKSYLSMFLSSNNESPDLSRAEIANVLSLIHLSNDCILK